MNFLAFKRNSNGKKPALERSLITWLISILDFIGAFGIAVLVRRLIPQVPSTHFLVEIWLLAFTLIWLITYDIDKNFRLSAYLTYIRVCRIAFWSVVGYLLFFVITRFFYSLTFLCWVTILWLAWAIALRWLLRRLLPPPQGLAFEDLPSILSANKGIQWTKNESEQICDITSFDFLLIDYAKTYNTATQALFLQALTKSIPIYSAAQLKELLIGRLSTEALQDFWTKTAFQVDIFYLRCKRWLDVLLTLTLSPLLIILSLVVAILILIYMGRPIFFWQERVGQDNKLFKMLKFRSMILNAQAYGTAYTEKNDARITRLGIWLRRLHLDEIPQFYNILIGDMSLIGPRPEHSLLAENFTLNIPYYQIRHWLRPGITGWAQVKQGYAANMEEVTEKLEYDMYYLKHISFWLDLIIIYKTVVAVLTGFNSR